MPGTIVCGVDDSDASDAVTDTARWLANSFGARLVLIHVAEEEVAQAEKLTASIRDRLSLGARDDMLLVEGSPAERLLESVETEGADFVVVGSRGRGPVTSALFGSVSRTLATASRCPVVVVPPGVTAPDHLSGSLGDRGSIVCGVDGSEHSLAAARLGGVIAARMGYRLIVVHALSVAQSVVSYPGMRDSAPPLSGQPDSRRRLADELVDDAVRAAGVEATGFVESGLPWDVLEMVADREDGRMLVVAARGLSPMQTAVFGSAAMRVATSSRRPVVILPEPAEEQVVAVDTR